MSSVTRRFAVLFSAGALLLWLAHSAAAEVSMIPQSYVKLTGKEAGQMLRLMEDLEDHDDVQHVYANFDIEEAEMHALTEAR